MSAYLMQARSSISGALTSWTSSTPDFAALLFPGPGLAEYVAVSGKFQPEIAGGSINLPANPSENNYFAVGAAGNLDYLDSADATALLDEVTSSTPGLAPASGGGTLNFLRADGTWSVPPTTPSGAAGGSLTGSYPNPTITNEAVTLSMMANISSDRLLGRDSIGLGQPEELELNGGIEFTGGGGIRRSALTGDVTAAAGSNACTIANNVVTLGKLAQVGTDSLLGRDTAGTGNVESIGLDASLEMSGIQILRRAALTGDVTASAGSNACTIPNNTITNAKAADMAAATLKGRAVGGGTGDPQDLTPVQAADVVLPTMEFDFNVPGLSDGASAEVTLDVTGLGLTPGDNVFVSPRPETSSWPVRAFVGAPRCQVADALIVPIAAIGGAVSSATCSMVVTRRPR